jgi:predicted transcriptional regulator
MADKKKPGAKRHTPEGATPLFYNPEAYIEELTQGFISEYINSYMVRRLIFPHKDMTQDKIDAIIDHIRQYNEIAEQSTLMRGKLGQYVVITSSAHANLLVEDTTLGAALVEQIRDESTTLEVWKQLYRETYGNKEPVPLEISRFERYANQCMLISQVSCGVCGIMEEAEHPKEGELQESILLSSRQVEQATIQTFMSSLVESGIPITNNVMQLIIYFTRRVLRATFNSNYENIVDNLTDEEKIDKTWYEQIQEIADSDTSWSSYSVNVAENICKNFTCEASPDEPERLYANYGMHVNLMGDVVPDMTIRNIMTNHVKYIDDIFAINRDDMTNPNITIAVRSIELLHETRQTNLAALLAIANAFKLKLALFDSGCEYYQDRKHVKVLRCGKVVATQEQKEKSEKMPAHVKDMQPPADSQQLDDYWEPELGGGNRRRRTAKKKPRRRAKRKTNRPKRKYKYRYTKRKHNNKRSTR